MRIVYKDAKSLIEQLSQIVIKNRIEKEKPPMEVDFETNEVNGIELVPDDYSEQKLTQQTIEQIKQYDSMYDNPIIEDPYSSVVSAIAYSQYFNSITSQEIKSGENYTDIIYKPTFIEHDNKLIEFRISGLLIMNLYDLSNNIIENIITKKDGYESSVTFLLDEYNYEKEYEEQTRQVDVDRFEDDGIREVFKNIQSKYICIIPQEVNMIKALEDKQIIEKLEKSGLDIEKMNGFNTKIYINNEELLFQEKYKAYPVTELLSKNEYRYNYELIKEIENSKLKLSHEENFDIDKFNEQYDMLVHNQLNTIEYNKDYEVSENTNKDTLNKID